MQPFLGITLTLIGCLPALGWTTPPSLQGAASGDWAARFWSASSTAERDEVAGQWIATDPDFDVVWNALQAGRRFPADAPRGRVLSKHAGLGGLIHPYLILVPERYTPEKRWPVRLELHGGMGAEEWDPDDPQWAGGWTHAGDHIIVLPAGWIDSMWWQDSQVENLQAILREVRATWNVDENRVVPVGGSDGGAALYFLAMRFPDQFAGYAGTVAPPDRLVRADFEPDGQMHVSNLRGQRFHLDFGETDHKVPIKYLTRYMELFESMGADLDWYVHKGVGHSLILGEERLQSFIDFVWGIVRDPLPDELSWSTEDVERFGRRSWLSIDRLMEAERGAPIDESRLLPRWGTPIQLRGKTSPREPYGTVELERDGNRVRAIAENVAKFRLFLSPEEFDFAKPVVLELNGVVVREESVQRSVPTLLKRAARDDDREMMFAAEWVVEVDEP